MTTVVLYKGVLAADSCNNKTLQDKNFKFNDTNKIFVFTNEVYYNNIKVLAGSAAGTENTILRMFRILKDKACNLEKEFKRISNSLSGEEASFIFLLENGNGLFISEYLNDEGLFQWKIEEIDYKSVFILGSGYDFVNDLKLNKAITYCEIACVFDKYSSFPIYAFDAETKTKQNINSIQNSTKFRIKKLFN